MSFFIKSMKTLEASWAPSGWGPGSLPWSTPKTGRSSPRGYRPLWDTEVALGVSLENHNRHNWIAFREGHRQEQRYLGSIACERLNCSNALRAEQLTPQRGAIISSGNASGLRESSALFPMRLGV